NHRAPLREERRSTVAVRIPQRQFAAPDRRSMVRGRGNRQHAEIAIAESLAPEQHRKEGSGQNKAEKQRDIARAKRRRRIAYAGFGLHTRRKIARIAAVIKERIAPRRKA